jgi:hypothetical protein
MDDKRAGRRSPLEAARAHQWSAGERVVFISALAILMGALFVTTYSLALGDPVPHQIDAAVIGDPAAHAPTVSAVQQVADNSLLLHRYRSAALALRAIDHQQVYAALDLTTGRPTLYVASAAGASVARLLERVSALDPEVRVVDAHPLDPHDPSGVDIFYLMLVSTIVGFITVFQLVAHAGPLSNRQWWLVIVLVSIVASLVFALVEGPILERIDLPVPEGWGILALQVLGVASFARLMTVLIGRWAILPTWVFFVVLGNSSSGGAVAPPLLPHPFALVSQWLPSGATVTALRNAVYFNDYQQARPILVLAAWSAVLFAGMMVASRRSSPT